MGTGNENESYDGQRCITCNVKLINRVLYCFQVASGFFEGDMQIWRTANDRIIFRYDAGKFTKKNCNS